MTADWQTIVPVPISVADDPDAVEQSRVEAGRLAARVGVVLTTGHKVRYDGVILDGDGEVCYDLAGQGLAALVFDGNRDTTTRH